MTRPSAEALNGVDIEHVEAWLDMNIDGAKGPYGCTMILVGLPNPTVEFTDAAGGEFVVRQPPLRHVPVGHVMASAHDMSRHHRIGCGLQTSTVPVAPMSGICADAEIDGSPAARPRASRSVERLR